MSKKISLNPKYDTHYSGSTLWTLISKDNIEYYNSQNKSHSSVTALKCEFTTPYDNIDIQVEIGASSETNYDWCYIGKLDNSNPTYDSNYIDRISGYNNFKTITINVAKAGTHFLIIGYRKDSSSSAYDDCGYFRLITTEVDSIEPTKTKYIYCGTKKTFKPIEFSKSDSNGVWNTYTGSDAMYQWTTDGASSNINNIAKILFKTTSDNIELDLIYHIYFNTRQAKFCVGSVDNASLSFSSSDYIYEKGFMEKTVSKKIIVPKAGDHFINIGCFKYDRFKDNVDIGFSGSNIILNNLTPGNILANNKNIGKVYVGSELIWSKPMNNNISWETLTWDKSNNSYTYNTKGKLYISYSYGNNNYETYLLSSPASVPHQDEITKVKFYNINSYQGNSYNCTYKLDLSEFNTYNFNSMYGMFNNCSSLTNIDVSNFNTSNVTNMNSMFYNCSSITKLDVSNFNTSNVTDMLSIFYKCSSLTSLDLSKWDTSKVTSMDSMFYNCKALTSLDVSKLDTSKVTNMKYLFFGCLSLTSLDLSKWDTSKVTNMFGMFYFSYSLNSLDVSNFNTSNVTSMDYMFNNCSALTSLDVSKWDTSKVTNMQYMFDNCNKLTKLDLSKWDVSNVTNMHGMFSRCSSLTTLIDGHEYEPDVFALNNLKISFDLKSCTKLNYESVYALFRGLAKVTTTQTITLPKVMQGKLDATKVKIATDKGWTIKYE